MMEELYEMKNELARGNQGVIRLCTHKATGQDFACKSTLVPSSAIIHGPSSPYYARYEAAALSALGAHPNVIFLHAHFEDTSGVHLILDLCRGGDILEHVSSLQSKLAERQASTSCDKSEDSPPPRSLSSDDWILTELQVAEIFSATLRAVAFCHGRGIMHGDIKIENLLLPTEGSSYTEIKLADFGFAYRFRCSNGQRNAGCSMQGTLAYMAPEILRGISYDEKADIWSLGVLLFLLLCWQFPFQGKTRQEVLNAMDILRHPNWEQAVPSPIASPLAKDILKKMLVVNPLERNPACFLLSHPWLREHHLAGPGSTLPKIEQPPSPKSCLADVQSRDGSLQR